MACFTSPASSGCFSIGGAAGSSIYVSHQFDGRFPLESCSVVAGTFGIIVILTHWYFFILDNDVADKFDRNQAKVALISLSLYISIFVSGFLDPNPGLYTIAGICTWLLFSGASEAWLLLSRQEHSKKTERKVFTREFSNWVDSIRNQGERSSPGKSTRA
jgi:hypothetical protein